MLIVENKTCAEIAKLLFSETIFNCGRIANIGNFVREILWKTHLFK
jgi:hypothetical protein